LENKEARGFSVAAPWFEFEFSLMATAMENQHFDENYEYDHQNFAESDG